MDVLVPGRMSQKLTKRSGEVVIESPVCFATNNLFHWVDRITRHPKFLASRYYRTSKHIVGLYVGCDVEAVSIYKSLRDDLVAQSC